MDYQQISFLNLFSKMRFIVMFVTAVCVLFLVKLRWPKKKSLYDIVLGSYSAQYVESFPTQQNIQCGKKSRKNVILAGTNSALASDTSCSEYNLSLSLEKLILRAIN